MINSNLANFEGENLCINLVVGGCLNLDEY